MKAKTFVILSAFLIVISAVAFIVYQKERPTPSSEMGTPMIAEIPAGEITTIRMKTPQESIVLEKRSKGWVVQTRFQYPADFPRIMDLVNTVRDAKIGRSFDSSQEIRSRLGLISPDDATVDEGIRGTLIDLKNEKGASIATILIGKTRERGGRGDVPDGQYVMLGGSQRVYLVDRIFTSFETGNSSWLSKHPIRIKPEDIKKISCEGPESKGLGYVLKRPGKGEDFDLVIPPSGPNTDRAALNSLVNAFSSFQIEDVQLRTSANESGRRSKPGGLSKGGAGSQLSENGPNRIDFTLFNGVVYHLYPDPNCSESGPCTLKIDVGWEKPESEGGDKGKEGIAIGTDKQEKDKQPDVSVRATEENERLNPWIFMVDKWRHDAFIMSVQKLLMQDKEGKKGQAGK